MNQSQLRPAGQLARKMGVKSIAYGPPGGGKTPLLNTAPRPVLMACEPGLLSMQGSNLPTWEAYNRAAIKEFFDWLKSSAEVKNFDTVQIDSVSQLAEIVLADELPKHKDPRKAYGVLSQVVMEWMNQLYYMQQKHIFMIAKRMTVEENEFNFSGPFPTQTTVRKSYPYFPGQDLNIKIPHLYDEVLYVAKGQVPGVAGDKTPHIITVENSKVFARDRSGRLAEYEPHDLTALFAKAMQ